ncbi:hypothetical protein EDB19DRAFT_2023702 [Suillus lakei]|nr:hypothetical protein EDB19DRAFT_2023702 [Suillus lakei]
MAFAGTFRCIDITQVYCLLRDELSFSCPYTHNLLNGVESMTVTISLEEFAGSYALQHHVLSAIGAINPNKITPIIKQFPTLLPPKPTPLLVLPTVVGKSHANEEFWLNSKLITAKSRVCEVHVVFPAMQPTTDLAATTGRLMEVVTLAELAGQDSIQQYLAGQETHNGICVHFRLESLSNGNTYGQEGAKPMIPGVAKA